MADYIRFEIVNCDEVAIWLTHKGQTISRVQFSNDGGKTWEFNCLSTKQPMLKVATPKHQEFITAPVDRLTPDGVLDAVVKARESVGFVSSVAAPTKPTFDDAAFTKDLRLITERLLKEAGLAVSVILSETGKERTLQLTGGTEGKPGWFKTLPVVIRNDLGPLSWEKSIRALINTVKGDILSAQAAEAAKKEIDKMLNTQPKHRPLTQAVVDAAVSNAKKLGGTLQLCVHGSIDTSVMVPSNVLISHFPSSMEPGQWAIVFSNQADSGQPLDSSTWPEGTQSPYEFEQAVKAVAEAEGWKYNLSYSAWPTDGVWVKFTDPDGREYIKTCHSNDGVKEIALRFVVERVARIARKVFGDRVKTVFRDCSLVRVELDEGYILFRDDVSDQEILERAEMLKERGFHAKPSPIDSQPSAVVSSVKEEIGMPTNEKPIASKPTLTEIAKDDATEAAYRTAAKRMPKYARAALIRAFASRGATPEDRASRTRAMEDFLSGEFGDSIVAGALSAMISLSPDALKSRVPWIDMDRLARELRLKVEVSALDALVDVAEVYAATGVEMLTEAFRGSKIAGAIEAPKRDVMDTIRDGQVLSREEVRT